jgi:hypothetical protein
LDGADRKDWAGQQSQNFEQAQSTVTQPKPPTPQTVKSISRQK